MSSEVTSGPAIDATHGYNCVDQGFFNTSCSGGGQNIGQHAYSTANWTAPSEREIYFANNDTYHMDFQYGWFAAGYPYVWTSDTFTTNTWTCHSGGNCTFN